uniref:Uncharacterized protein n=1 Tax=viral metagenome TaxID=1070528 RepID=A0A6M3JX13_9ZZZZ
MGDENVNLFFRIINWIFSRWNWWQKWFGPGTADDWRNPFWRYTEYHGITVDKSYTVSDKRIGFFRLSDGKWVWWFSRQDKLWVGGVDSNFYNGIFTWNHTITKGHTRLGKEVTRRRYNIVIRFMHSFWFAFGVGTLPDRGEFGWTGPWFYTFKGQSKNNPGVIAPDHSEGSV